MKEQIEAFLQTNPAIDAHIALAFTPLEEINKILISLDFESIEYEKNGWQVDFWWYFEHKVYGIFCLAGSLHYGGFTFSKTNKDDYPPQDEIQLESYKDKENKEDTIDEKSNTKSINDFELQVREIFKRIEEEKIEKISKKIEEERP